MFNELTKKDVLDAVDELLPLFGVSELLSTKDIVTSAKRRQFASCVEDLAMRMGLPVRINLTMIPGYQSSTNSSFHQFFKSTDLVYATDSQAGREGITAQVAMPHDLPLFGTERLNGFTLDVMVSENCCNHPESFVAIMAHELSHILLATLLSPYKNSELHTEIVPLLLGFRAIVAAGRNAIEKRQTGEAGQVLIKYGYLTDSQFDAARLYIEKVVTRRNREKKRLRGHVVKLENLIEETVCMTEEHSLLMKLLDESPPSKMRTSDAIKIVNIHNNHPGKEWGTLLEKAKSESVKARHFTDSSEHYTERWVEQMTVYVEKLEEYFGSILDVFERARENVSIMSRYAGIKYRVKRFFVSTPVRNYRWCDDESVPRDVL